MQLPGQIVFQHEIANYIEGMVSRRQIESHPRPDEIRLSPKEKLKLIIEAFLDGRLKEIDIMRLCYQLTLSQSLDVLSGELLRYVLSNARQRHYPYKVELPHPGCCDLYHLSIEFFQKTRIACCWNPDWKAYLRDKLPSYLNVNDVPRVLIRNIQIILPQILGYFEKYKRFPDLGRWVDCHLRPGCGLPGERR